MQAWGEWRGECCFTVASAVAAVGKVLRPSHRGTVCPPKGHWREYTLRLPLKSNL